MPQKVPLSTYETRMSIALFFAIISTALYLAAELAHLFALPNKIELPQAQYFAVQSIYNGWWQVAYAVVIQILSIAAVIVLARRESLQFWCGLVAVLCVLGTQVIFWSNTQPANSATQSWTMQPDNWEQLRSQWEYSHAAGAVFQMVGFVALVVAAVSRIRIPETADF